MRGGCAPPASTIPGLSTCGRSTYSRIDAWLGRLTDAGHLEATCQAIAGASDHLANRSPERVAARQLLADCDRRLARYRAALEAGTDPAVVGQWIAEVTTARHAA